MPKCKNSKNMLRTKMFRDIMRHKTQFISIFLMTFLAVFIYAGIGGEWRGLQHSVDRYYEETNIADVFLFGNGFNDDQKNGIANIDGVISIERRTIIKAMGKSSSKGVFEEAPEISIHFVEENKISKSQLVEGEEFDIEDMEGIWLGQRFSKANDLKVGDKITLNISGFEVEKEIKGIIHSSEYVFMDSNGGMTPDFMKNGYAYLSHKAFPSPEHFVYSTILIKTDKSEETQLEEKIDDVLDGKYNLYLEQKNHPSVAMFQNEILQHKMMGDIFPVVFLLVALLTMMTTMTRIVNSQRVQIGVLKAMGVGRGKILRHYISYGFWLALMGSITGCVIGPLTLPELFYPSMSGFYTIPVWKSVYHISFVIVTILVVLLCAAVTWIACSKQLKDTPAQTLRPKAPKISKHSFVEKITLWKCIGFNTQWNLRDAARNKIRSTMAVIGVLGCTALLVCAFGMNDSMRILKEWQYETISRFESKINLEESITEEDFNTILNGVKGEALMEIGIEVRTKIGNVTKKSGSILVKDNVSLIQSTGSNREPISLPEDGVAMTMKLADILGVSVGDTIEWHIYGSEEWVNTKIAALYRDPSVQGLTMSKDVFEGLGYNFKPTSIVTSEKVTAHYNGVSAVLSVSDIVGGWDDLTEAMLTMVFVLIAGAAVLSIVVLYNLGLLSFTEMERDMATLKVMGMKTKKLRGLLLTQNIWFSAVGFLLGLPCGIWLIKAITDSSGDTFDFPVELTVGTAIVSFAITFGLSVFAGLLFSKKIKRIDMVEALKSVE